MSPEQYAAEYGVEALAKELTPEQAATAAAGLQDSLTARAAKGPRKADSEFRVMDPGGGNDGQWWSVLYGTKNKRKTYIPIRLGNSNFGYKHYAARHNLLFYQPFHAAMQTSKPDLELGAHTEYLALFVKNLDVKQTMRFIVQEATKTEDRSFESPDGAYIGVITAYCEDRRHDANRCPKWINDKSTF